MLIGSKVWEFAGKDSNDTTSTRKKTIPVSAISSVDFVLYPKWLLHLPTIIGVIAIISMLFITTESDRLPFQYGFYLEEWVIIIGVALVILGIKLNKKFGGWGKIEVITNNVSSSFCYHYVSGNDAGKYIEPMRECLLEKEG